jgi:Rod binding domain-containing protein
MTFFAIHGNASTPHSGSLGATGAATPDPKLAKLASAAQSFEAMMLNEMLKPLHFGAGVADGAEESEGGASDTIKGMATDALGKALAASGGVGIARKIVKQVTAEEEATNVRRGETKVQ